MTEEEFDAIRVADVVDAVGGVDSGTVREALDPVTDGDRVTPEAVAAAVSDTSKLLATAETRVELAGNAYSGAREAAGHVADLAVVDRRLDEFDERLSAVESRLTDVEPPRATPTDPSSVYDLAVDLRDVATTAQGIIGTADDLSLDIEQFRSWLDRPSRRYDELSEDVDLVAEAAEELSTAVDALPRDTPDPAATWVDATMQARLLSVLVADLRAERHDLREFAEQTGNPFQSELGERIDRIAGQVDDIESQLHTRAEPAWRDRFGGDLRAFDDALAAFEPPVEWGAVEECLERHRPETNEQTDRVADPSETGSAAE
jgi:hypothetical protein